MTKPFNEDMTVFWTIGDGKAGHFSKENMQMAMKDMKRWNKWIS